MILLDTNAIIWSVTNHRRGRVRLQDLIEDDRWAVDDPPAVEWFTRASEESWTCDPFDRLIVAHARLRRARVATGDGRILEHLRPSETLAL